LSIGQRSVTVAHAGAGQTRLVGEETALRELDDAEAQTRRVPDTIFASALRASGPLRLARLISEFQIGHASTSA
jgi:hypothetical protein